MSCPACVTLSLYFLVCFTETIRRLIYETNSVPQAVQRANILFLQVIILHIRPTSVLYGADWGASDIVLSTADRDSAQKLENDFDSLTAGKSEELAAPLKAAGITYRIVIFKDHDMKERLCLEVRG